VHVAAIELVVLEQAMKAKALVTQRCRLVQRAACSAAGSGRNHGRDQRATG
jgi:hypothetical protein